MPNNQVGLDLNIIDNQITNINEILSFINDGALDSSFIEHITTLKNRLVEMEIKNKEELENAIDSKIMEFESHNKKEIDNLEALRLLQQTNEEFQKISVIETKPDKNDSNKYIDYFTYVNEYGEVEVLSFTNSNTLNNYIKQNSDVIPTYTAKELFDHLKNYGCEELNFETKDELDKNDLAKKNVIVNDPEIERQELQEIEDYKSKYAISEETRISISENGERLYQIGDGLIKFRTSDNKRVMEVLKQPSIKKTNIYDELLSELEETPTIIETETIKVETSTSADSYTSLENISENNFNKEELIDLVSKRDIYDMTLSMDEEHKLNIYIKYLIESCESNLDNREIIIDLMEKPRGDKQSIVEKYEAIENGTLDKNELTSLEKEFAQNYLDKKEKFKDLDLKQENKKKLELKQESNSGISTIVMLLEIIILAMFIMMFLRLDI